MFFLSWWWMYVCALIDALRAYRRNTPYLAMRGSVRSLLHFDDPPVSRSASHSMPSSTPSPVSALLDLMEWQQQRSQHQHSARTRSSA